MMWKLIFLITNLALAIGSVEHKKRTKRYLIYPDGGPARAQFIIGLGVPVDLKEQSVTVGSVIKFQYFLPINSSEYTTRIYGFANTVSRDMDDNNNVDEEKSDESERTLSDGKDIGRTDNLEKAHESGESNSAENNDDTLVDITFDRKKRALAYSEAGAIIQNGIDTTEVPLEEAIRRQELIDKKYQEQDNSVPKQANRWDLYKIIEHMAERYGYTGRPCLLRTICEAADVPFTHENGLLGEIGHILFTPSTSRDALSHHTDNEYHAAERLGRQVGVDCESLFPECEGSVLSTFTDIGLDTLHKFGLA